MSKHRFILEAEVDDEALERWLASSNSKARPPYGGPETWNASDLVAASGMELVEADESELTYDGKVG